MRLTWRRIHRGGFIEEIARTPCDLFEASVRTPNVRLVLGSVSSFDDAERLTLRQLHAWEHWRCSSGCELDWTPAGGLLGQRLAGTGRRGK